MQRNVEGISGDGRVHGLVVNSQEKILTVVGSGGKLVGFKCK